MNTFQFLTTHEAAEQLYVHPQTIRRWCNSGKLPYQRHGAIRAIHKDDVQKLLQAAKEAKVKQ